MTPFARAHTSIDALTLLFVRSRILSRRSATGDAVSRKQSTKSLNNCTCVCAYLCACACDRRIKRSKPKSLMHMKIPWNVRVRVDCSAFVSATDNA